MAEKFPCFYPIFHLPPTVFNFNTALILSNRENISNVIVVIPKLQYTYLNQDQCVKLLELYRTADPMMDVRVEASQYENAFRDLQERFKKDPNLMAYVALDEKTAKSSEFNKLFADFDNLNIELVPSTFEKTADKMRKAIETGDKAAFLKYIPEGLREDHQDDAWAIVHSEIEEQIVSKDYWKSVLSEYFDQEDTITKSETK